MKFVNIKFGLLLVVSFAAGAYVGWPESVPMKEYRAVVNNGESIWQVCERYTSNRDNLNKVVWETCQRNNIKRPGLVQPGTVIYIQVIDTGEGETYKSKSRSGF